MFDMAVDCANGMGRRNIQYFAGLPVEHGNNKIDSVCMCLVPNGKSVNYEPIDIKNIFLILHEELMKTRLNQTACETEFYLKFYYKQYVQVKCF